jgi:hypothetical protein
MIEIFKPMGAMALLTFCVLGIVAFSRFRAGATGKVTLNDFAAGESEAVPPEARIPNRNVINLLETPVLFYVVCLMFAVRGTTPALALTLAWSYVGLRVAHSAIHLTYNRVAHRFVAFLASLAMLMALWAVFFLTP